MFATNGGQLVTKTFGLHPGKRCGNDVPGLLLHAPVVQVGLALQGLPDDTLEGLHLGLAEVIAQLTVRAPASAKTPLADL